MGIKYTSIAWIRSFSMPIKCLVSILSYKISSKYPLGLWYYRKGQCFIRCFFVQFRFTDLYKSLMLLQVLFVLTTLTLNYIHYFHSDLALALVSFLLVIFECIRATLVVGVMSFHAKISDQKFGGLLMSIYAAASNFGKTWPGTVSLYSMDKIDNYNFICTVCTIFSIIWLATTRSTISKFSRSDFEMEKHCKENALLT